jgi:hypothetical protein
MTGTSTSARIVADVQHRAVSLDNGSLCDRRQRREHRVCLSQTRGTHGSHHVAGQAGGGGTLLKDGNVMTNEFGSA